MTISGVAYEALGIPEYWRFDETGQYHGTRLAGDRLVDGVYVPIDIEELSDGVLQGYSPALGLNLRWEGGEFVLHDPETGRRIATLEDERAERLRAEARADQESAARERAEARAGDERAARLQAEAERDAEAARVRELEAQLKRLRGE